MRRSEALRALALSVVAVVVACDNVLSPGEVRIRVENASALDFTSTIVGFPQQTEDYGSVGAGHASEYRTIGQAYRYAYFEVSAGGRGTCCSRSTTWAKNCWRRARTRIS